MKETLRFRAFKLLLRLNITWAALIVGVLYLPVMFFLPDPFFEFILFMACMGFLCWLALIPRWNVREDNTVYEMDAKERTEKYFVAKGWWIYERQPWD